MKKCCLIAAMLLCLVSCQKKPTSLADDYRGDRYERREERREDRDSRYRDRDDYDYRDDRPWWKLW